MVKFTKKQIDALSQIEVKANKLFDKDLKKSPNLYKESDRSHVVRCYMVGILKNVIEKGAICV